MTRTTRPPEHRVDELFPALAGRERVTVRLHPRRGPEPPDDATKLGGRVRWPRGEPWPACELSHDGYDLDRHLAHYVLEPDGRPYVAVLQLRRDDVPEAGFPEAADVFQLLWCPASHPGLFGPAIRTFWWSSAGLAPFEPPPPVPDPEETQYVPRPCILHPERVVEYPDPAELDGDVWSMIGAWEDRLGEPAYRYLLSAAPGTKVGGYPDWLQDPEYPSCGAGHAMDHLLTVSDTEFDGGTFPRWLAVEDAGTWDGPLDDRFAVQGAIGIELGMGSIYVFICRRCADWPIAQAYQR